MENWIELDKSEYDIIWDKFYSRFQFRPNISAFPGIDEPKHSATWSLNNIFNPDSYDQVVDRYNAIIHEPFKKMCPLTSDFVYALDWQHTCYRFYPSRPINPTKPWNKVSFVPDGDYSIFLMPEMESGCFGHPWETTLCVWGDDLVKEITTPLTQLFGEPLRQK